MDSDYEFKNLDNKTISNALVSDLKKKALKSATNIYRYNLHKDFNDPLQEMIICSYVKDERSHRHKTKDEVIQVVEGKILIRIFDENHLLLQSFFISSDSGQSFIRIKRGTWHSTTIDSSFAIYHEVCTGPFIPEDIEYYEQS